MGDLCDFLRRHKRSFPIGLSGKTGMGYILTGGISPLSRSKGLAIDQILEIKGFWGNGREFHFSRPNSLEESTLEWKALCGAAIFLGIITKVKLKTQPLKPHSLGRERTRGINKKLYSPHQTLMFLAQFHLIKLMISLWPY